MDVWGSGFWLTWWMSHCSTDSWGLHPAHCIAPPLQQAGFLLPLHLTGSVCLGLVCLLQTSAPWLCPLFLGMAVPLFFWNSGLWRPPPRPQESLRCMLTVSSPGPWLSSVPEVTTNPTSMPYPNPPPEIQHNPQRLVVSAFCGVFFFFCLLLPHCWKLTSYDSNNFFHRKKREKTTTHLFD